MTAFLPVIAALAMGWGLWRRFGERGSVAATLAASALAGIAALVAWMALLDLAGVRWSPGMLLAPAVPALVLGIATRRQPLPAPAPSWWAALAAAAVALRVVTVTAIPAFGWDFRYIWGLKARVFALAGCHDPTWLTWPGHGFAHPGYPPAWADLIAAGVVLGADAGAVAAVWQAILMAILAAACWEISRDCPGWLRALVAAAAAWTPTMSDPIFSGYAEPLLAVPAALGLHALARLQSGDRNATTLLAVACGVLAATKYEGLMLAIGLGAGATLAGGPRRALPAVAATAVAGAAWQLAILAGVAPVDHGFAPSPGAVLAHAAAFPAALVAALQRNHLIDFVLATWASVLLVWWVRELRGVRLACGVWALSVAAAYLTTTADLTWHLANSAERVLAVPLPAVLALAVSARFRREPAAAGPPAPARSRGGSPSV